MQASTAQQQIAGSKRPRPTDTPKQRRKFTKDARIFVYGIFKGTTPDSLQKLFEEFGKVGEVIRPDGKSFAFVQMDLAENALRAINELQGCVLDGVTLRLRLALSNAAVWVGDIPRWVDNESLASAFQRFGDVERAVVASDIGGANLTYGHVFFASRNSAESAIATASGGRLVMGGAARPVRVAKLAHADVIVGCQPRDRRGGSEYTQPGGLARSDQALLLMVEDGTLASSFAKRWSQIRREYEAERQMQRTRYAEKVKALEAEATAALASAREREQAAWFQQLAKEQALIQGQNMEIMRIQMQHQEQQMALRSSFNRLPSSSLPPAIVHAGRPAIVHAGRPPPPSRGGNMGAMLPGPPPPPPSVRGNTGAMLPLPPAPPTPLGGARMPPPRPPRPLLAGARGPPPRPPPPPLGGARTSPPRPLGGGRPLPPRPLLAGAGGPPPRPRPPMPVHRGGAGDILGVGIAGIGMLSPPSNSGPRFTSY